MENVRLCTFTHTNGENVVVAKAAALDQAGYRARVAAVMLGMATNYFMAPQRRIDLVNGSQPLEAE